jgi:hypothetical protein
VEIKAALGDLKVRRLDCRFCKIADAGAYSKSAPIDLDSWLPVHIDLPILSVAKHSHASAVYGIIEYLRLESFELGVAFEAGNKKSFHWINA